MIIEKVVVGNLETNCYILAVEKGQDCVLIDPGDQPEVIMKCLKKNDLKPAFIVHTHGHIDHIGADNAFSVPVYVHKDDVSLLGDPELNFSSAFTFPYRVKTEIRSFGDNDSIEGAGITLKALHTPGHTPGGVSLLLLKPKSGIIFTGDTLFYRSIGRSDLVYSDPEKLIDSIRSKIFTLGDNYIVYPGHGPATSIGQEKRFNPFLS